METEPRASLLAHAVACRAALAENKIRPKYRGPSVAGFILAGLDLSGVNLSGLWLKNTQFNYVNLRGADFTGADMREVFFLGADLTGSCLLNTDLLRVDLTGAQGILEIKPLGASGRSLFAVDHPGGPFIKFGCHWGDMESTRKALDLRYGENSRMASHRPVLLAALAFVETRFPTFDATSPAALDGLTG